MTQPLCRHCNAKCASRPLGLCYACYYAPGVRELYPSTSKYCPKSDGRDKALRERKPNEAPCRCLWCLKWRCGEPLQLCGACQAWYDQRSQGMPSKEHLK